MRVTISATLATLALFMSPAAAQTTTSTIVRVPGKTIEVLGLRRWTPAMIQDSMNRYSPGDSLSSHACAAVLRYRLHFAAAASLLMPGDTAEYVLLPVIEPQDSALVQYRELPRDTTNSQAPWPELVALARTEGQVLGSAVLARIAARGSGRAPEVPQSMVADSGAIQRVWAVLDAHRSARDAAAARRLLQGGPNIYDRVAAVAILSSFPMEDATWHTLAASLREADSWPPLFAGEVLRALAQAQPRPVNWRPASEDLHAVLNGSNLWVLDQVLEALVATGVGPDVAQPLLGDGGHAVLMYAGAAHPRFRDPAQRFLRAVSGRDYGDDVVAWKAWIARAAP